MSKPHHPTDIESEDLGAEPPEELLADDDLASPADYSAVGGPDNEPSYGRTRPMAGEYPFNEQGGPRDRDEPSHVERGGIQTHHRIEKRT